MAENLFRELEVIDDFGRKLEYRSRYRTLEVRQSRRIKWYAESVHISLRRTVMAIGYTVSSKAVRRSLLLPFSLQNNLIVGDFFRRDAELLALVAIDRQKYPRRPTNEFSTCPRRHSCSPDTLDCSL